jgi:hypothetical protein
MVSSPQRVRKVPRAEHIVSSRFHPYDHCRGQRPARAGVYGAPIRHLFAAVLLLALLQLLRLFSPRVGQCLNSGIL